MNLLRLLVIAPLFFYSCRQKEKPATLFTELPSSLTHIDFRNDIKENEDYNILTYEYLYNGGGVAVGDVNGDGLPDIYLTGNMTGNKLYLNKGNFQFEDITESAGVRGRDKWKTGAVMADVNGDGLLDIFVCYSGPGSDADRADELYINNGLKNGVPVFTESAKKYGLDAPGTYTTTVAFFDFDHDGDLDMFMVNHADMFFNPFFNTDKLRAKRHPKFGNRLYRNDGGHFTDISEQAHIDGSGLNFGLSVATSDINGDGWPDIYVTNDYDERDFLYLNNHDGTFREVLTKAAAHISEFAMGSDIADYNNDGKPDIVVLDMLPEDNHRQKLLRGADNYDKYTLRAQHGFHHQQMRNTLQMNNGNGPDSIPLFSEVGQLAGMSNTDWSWSPLLADFDNDGWKDLFISNGILRDITNLDFVKYTSGYTVGQAEKKGDKFDMWKLVQEMPSTKMTNYLFHNNHDLSFSNMTTAWGFTRKAISNGAAYVDLDNDGDLDMVINTLNDGPILYRNNASEMHKGHYLRIRLQGEKPNTEGIGAKVYVNTTQGSQFQEQYLSRGFQSSVDPVMHIGCGLDSVIGSITVIWPTGKVSRIEHCKADTLLTIPEREALPGNIGHPASGTPGNSASRTEPAGVPTPVSAMSPAGPASPLFTDITVPSGINYIHQPSEFVDFKVYPLLPYQVSKMGPCLAKGDVNGDGLEDLFIGGSAGQESRLYLQTAEGVFRPAPLQPWNSDKDHTNTGALFFDADGDGDLDCYLVSGGADYPRDSRNYQDRLFENDGKGNFRLVPDALPAETISGSCVRTADYNRDGRPDLFVGGKLVPGLFPVTPESLLLKNNSRPGHILFERDSTGQDSLLAQPGAGPGLVADACWIDLNKDGWPDLVLAGSFMPITIFENKEGKLINQTRAYGLDHTQGWWTSILAEDFDHDGNIDLVVGNLGTNTQFRASDKEPLKIWYGDFSGNKTFDPILTYYIQGKSYPYASRDELLRELPAQQKKFSRYETYSDAQIEDLFTPEQINAAGVKEIRMLSSVYLHNDGQRHWTLQNLPQRCQISMINGWVPTMIGGKQSLVLAGNCYPFRAQLGPLDAGIGLVLQMDEKGHFTSLPYDRTGLCIPGDVRSLIGLKGKKQEFIVAASYNGAVQVLRKQP
ncbi:MAG TPA: VCBS repeat-containing protein [Puia sp.]|nr:VCBS repeat-containing protein [Puia sp.]